MFCFCSKLVCNVVVCESNKSINIVMSGNKKLVLLRLEKQEKRLKDEPLQHAWVTREGVLNFHFCVYGLDGPYEGGFYHGVLELSEDYPFAPPKLMFFTPSGRFQVGKPICTSFTNFHKESWTSTWNVRTMVMATISFMTSEEQGAGYVSSSNLSKRQYAKNSFAHNKNNPLFRQLFKKQIRQQEANGFRNESKPSAVQFEQEGRANSRQLWVSVKLYGLYILLVIIVITWIALKE